MSNIVSIIIIIAVVIIRNAAKQNKTRAREANRILKDDREERDIRQAEKGPVSQASMASRSQSDSLTNAYNLWKDGNEREALKVLSGKNLSGRVTINELILMGEIYYEMQDYDQANLAFEKSIKRVPSAFVYSRLGEIAEANELYKEAIKYYKKALTLKDAKKGYIYHQLGDLYLFVGDDDKSNDYFEKAEAYHAEGQSTKLEAYDFFQQSYQKKRSSNPFVWMILSVLLITGFISFFIFRADTYEYSNEIVEVAVEDHYDEAQVELKEETEALDIVKIYDRAFGNSNSNIFYGGFVLEYDGQTFAVDYDQIMVIDEVNDTEEIAFEALAPAYINFMDDTFYYLSYGDRFLLNAYSKESGYETLDTFESPRDLLVDPYYLYLLDDGEDQIFYVRNLESSAYKRFKSDDIYSMAQTLDRLYFLKSSDVCYLEKDNLLKLDHLDSYLEYILTDVDFMTIEDDYMFYIKDETMYKRNLKTGQELVIFRDLDIDQITINAYHGELFIGHKGDNPYTVIYDFDGVYIGTVSDYLGNQISNDYLYWYE